MILILDFGHDWLAFGAVEGGKSRWRRVAAGTSAFRALRRVLQEFELDRRAPTGVAVVLRERREGAPYVAWSTVRQAVAMGNTLAFAWGAPAAAIRVQGTEKPDELGVLAVQALAKAKPGDWIRAVYSGEPNITKPKSKL